MKPIQTKRLTVSAVMLALSTVLAAVCALIPFLQLPMGGGITLASMLPIVIVSYMYGVKWGLFTAFTYSVIQVVMDLMLGVSGSVIMALFMPENDSYMGIFAGICILLLDYLVAYTVVGLGGIFRDRFESKAKALCLGSVVAVGLRFVSHVISGYIFYGAWAEWFFSQESLGAFGQAVLATFDGQLLAFIYSLCYNGFYMIPEIIITAIAAVAVSRISQVKKY